MLVAVCGMIPYMKASKIIVSGLLASIAAPAFAVPPRFIATPVAGLAFPCSISGSNAPITGVALSADGRVLGHANCGSTLSGSRAFVTDASGAVTELPHGTFNFTEPAAFLGGSRYLLIGNWCPPVNGTCTTALALAEGTTALTVLASSSVASSTCNDANEHGWAVGWSGASTTNAYRVRPDATLETLDVPKASGESVAGVNLSGLAVGSAYVSNQLRAVTWSASGVATVLPSVETGTFSDARGVGHDGSVVGQSNGRAAWWFNGNPIAMMPVGSASVATHMAGSPLTLDPLGYSIFGTAYNQTKFVRSNSMLSALEIGPFDASAQIQMLEVIAAPRADFMVGRGFTQLYQPVGFVWTLGDTVRRLDSLIVNPPASPQGYIVVDANASRQILINLGFNGAPYLLHELRQGDTNGDDLVNAVDLAETLAGWGTVPTGIREAGDFDGNGVVNGADIAVVLSNWN